MDPAYGLPRNPEAGATANTLSDPSRACARKGPRAAESEGVRLAEQPVDLQVEVGAVRSGDDARGPVRRQGRVAVELSSFAQGLTRFKTSSTSPEPGLLASSFGRSLPPPAGRQTV
jgi:hypothetical protein